MLAEPPLSEVRAVTARVSRSRMSDDMGLEAAGHEVSLLRLALHLELKRSTQPVGVDIVGPAALRHPSARAALPEREGRALFNALLCLRDPPRRSFLRYPPKSGELLRCRERELLVRGLYKDLYPY